MGDTEVDWWDRIGQAKWQHVVLAVAALAAVTNMAMTVIRANIQRIESS